ncbi:MAG: polyphosphate kinase 2 family protein [Myxococcota bacterium]
MSNKSLWKAPASPFLVSDDGKFKIADAPTEPKRRADKDELEAELEAQVEEIRSLQRKLYADDTYAVLFVFQAMDAAGKDGTIRAVFTGVNPAGFQVFSFGVPSKEELDHDFMWRVARRLPERGRIGVFNRSHYEEVVIARVHPQILANQRLPRIDEKDVWKERYQSIRGFEKHLARNGTVIVKFFLNVSRDQQKRRLLRRIDDPKRNWKFNPGDVDERERWPDYMEAFEDAINATSRSWAPWYAIPADDKPHMRVQVATIIRETLESLDLRFPEVDDETRAALGASRARLEEQ